MTSSPLFASVQFLVQCRCLSWQYLVNLSQASWPYVHHSHRPLPCINSGFILTARLSFTNVNGALKRKRMTPLPLLPSVSLPQAGMRGNKWHGAQQKKHHGYLLSNQKSLHVPPFLGRPFAIEFMLGIRHAGTPLHSCVYRHIGMCSHTGTHMNTHLPPPSTRAKQFTGFTEPIRFNLWKI